MVDKWSDTLTRLSKPDLHAEILKSISLDFICWFRSWLKISSVECMYHIASSFGLSLAWTHFVSSPPEPPKYLWTSVPYHARAVVLQRQTVCTCMKMDMASRGTSHGLIPYLSLLELGQTSPVCLPTQCATRWHSRAPRRWSCGGRIYTPCRCTLPPFESSEGQSAFDGHTSPVVSATLPWCARPLGAAETLVNTPC